MRPCLRYVISSVAVVLVAGCGGESSTVAHPSSTAPGSTAFAAPATYPDHDTPMAQAPPSLAAQWLPYSVTIIPSKHIFDSMPAPPNVVNQTNGAVPDATAQQWAIAFNREGALEQWADANSQWTFRSHLLSSVLNVGPEAQAVRAGQMVSAPNCFFFPARMTLEAVDSAISDSFKSVSQPTSAKYVFSVATAGADCVVTAHAPGAQPQVIDRLAGDTNVMFAGKVVSDPVLGPFWLSDAESLCPGPGLPTKYCATG